MAKPLVAAAFFCEQLLEEKDGVLSAIRIVDRYYVDRPQNLPKDAAIQVTGFVSLRSGEFTGPAHVKLRLRRSTTEPKYISPENGWAVVFNGGEHHINLRLNFPFEISDDGLFWFDVLVNDEMLTSMALKLITRKK